MTETNGRSETQILSRSGIPIEMGDTTYLLRPLTMDVSEKWEEKIRDVLAGMFVSLGTASGGIESVLGLYRQSIGAQLDALYSYDELGGKPVLPERGILRSTASRDDVDVALRKLVQHEFPLLKGMDFIGSWVPMEVRGIITRQLIRLLPAPEPTNPPEPSTSDSSTSTPATKTLRRSGRR